jgi:MFS superfamily sulfate permease-like transporter
MRTLREIWNIDRIEVGLAVVTTLGVVAAGAINGILIAVILALVRFVQLTARPDDEVLGAVDELPGLHSIERHPGARTFPGLVLYRFDAPLTFFNSDYFRTRALAEADAAGPGLRWFVIDTIPISQIDITGLYVLRP